jgi:pimeloyl-ACP methyl ester carboxylesterase
MSELADEQGTIHYEIHDFTPPWEVSSTILIQHGVGRNMRFWDRWIPGLARHYRVVLRDQRGHGESQLPKPSAEWSLTGLVEDMREFLDRLELDRVHYIGESSGGIVGLAFAERYPERVSSLTLCAVPLDVKPPKNDIFKVGFPDSTTAKRVLGSEGWTRAMMERRVISAGDSPEYEDWARRAMARTPEDALIGLGSTIYPPNPDLASLLPTVKVPVLVLAPARSPVTSLADQLTMAAALPDARITIIDGPGHEIQVDRRDECVAAVLGFLDRLEQADGGPGS